MYSFVDSAMISLLHASVAVRSSYSVRSRAAMPGRHRLEILRGAETLRDKLPEPRLPYRARSASTSGPNYRQRPGRVGTVSSNFLLVPTGSDNPTHEL